MNDPFAIEGLHVLITGGSSGLGRFFATFLAARGARVTVGARRAEALAKTVDDIGNAKGHAQSVVMDVTVAASIESALDAAEARFGPVEIVINNAGVTATRPALQQDEADWDKVIDTNLHLFDGVMPTMEKGDVLGHETMGEVLEVGSENKKLKVGDRVVVPFTISCGECFFCKKGFFSGCERSNPNHKMAEKLWGHSPAGLFGYSHMLGGYAGGQAE